MDVRRNHRLLITDSKRTRDSIIRFCKVLYSRCTRWWASRYVPGCSLPIEPGHIHWEQCRRLWRSRIRSNESTSSVRNVARQRRTCVLRAVWRVLVIRVYEAFPTIMNEIFWNLHRGWHGNTHVPSCRLMWSLTWPMLNRVSAIPALFFRARNASVSVGTKLDSPIRRTSEKKL